MPRCKCDSDVTDASDDAKRPRGSTRKPAHTGVSPPDWPRKGDHVQCTWAGGVIVEGIVLEADDRGWEPPSLWILTTEGERLNWRSRSVKVIARRARRPPAGKKKGTRRARKRKG